MKKAALVVDLPDNCLRCQFCIRHTQYPMCELDKLKGNEHNTTFENLDVKPEWCPLVTIPSRKEDCHGYNKGWNDCLDTLKLEN